MLGADAVPGLSLARAAGSTGVVGAVSTITVSLAANAYLLRGTPVTVFGLTDECELEARLFVA